jgi:hypothetical protein
MASLAKLIQAITPNFSLKELRAMVPWFDAVSEGIDGNSLMVASAMVDPAGAIQRSFGLATVNPVVHFGTGQYAVNLAETHNINELYALTNIVLSGSPPGGAINIYPAISSGSQLTLEIWQIALTTAARSRVDEGFVAALFLSPINTQ